MRLDQFLQKTCSFSRNEAQTAIRKGYVSVNGNCIKQAGYKLDLSADRVFYYEEEIKLHDAYYFMLHKPKGYVCSHEYDGGIPIFTLIEEQLQCKLHCAGRLDVDTTGLVLLTSSGEWLHNVIHPKKKQVKYYKVLLKEQVTRDQIAQLEKGVFLENDPDPTLPANVELISNYEVMLEIVEGRYHQVKRMFASVGNKVIGLHRTRIGNISLGDLEEGGYRLLSDEEIKGFI